MEVWWRRGSRNHDAGMGVMVHHGYKRQMGRTVHGETSRWVGLGIRGGSEGVSGDRVGSTSVHDHIHLVVRWMRGVSRGLQ